MQVALLYLYLSLYLSLYLYLSLSLYILPNNVALCYCSITCWCAHSIVQSSLVQSLQISFSFSFSFSFSSSSSSSFNNPHKSPSYQQSSLVLIDCIQYSSPYRSLSLALSLALSMIPMNLPHINSLVQSLQISCSFNDPINFAYLDRLVLIYRVQQYNPHVSLLSQQSSLVQSSLIWSLQIAFNYVFLCVLFNIQSNYYTNLSQLNSLIQSSVVQSNLVLIDLFLFLFLLLLLFQ